MPTGYPTWRCPNCGKVYYTLVNPCCPCSLGAIIESGITEDAWSRWMETYSAETELKQTNDMTAEIGVIIGRFQCPYLHDGHMEILKHVSSQHPRVFVFIGQSPLKCTQNDPLDFNTRRAMIEEAFPDIEVHRIDDVGDNSRWSRELDKQIDLLAGPTQTVILYGSRDSFLKAYEGKHATAELKATRYVSATEIRKEIGIRSKRTREFREGAVWAAQNQWPKVYATVDIAAVDFHTNEVLLCRKPNESLFRFPGGFADVNCESYENDALRELEEETQLGGAAIEYVGSTIIDDWRYRSQIDKIKTLFYAVTQWVGIPKASDDLKGGEVKFFSLDNIQPEMLVPSHRVLLTMLLNWMDKIRAMEKILSNKNNA